MITFKMAGGCGEEASAQKNQNWGYYEANDGPMKNYNGNYRRWVESRIFGRTLPQNLMTNASTNSINYTTMHETCFKPTSDVTNALTNMFRRNMFTLIMFRL